MKIGVVVFIGNPFTRKMLPRGSKKDRIINAVETYYGVDTREKTRRREIIFPRQVAMVMLNEMTKMGVVKIGAEFNMTHSPVINAQYTVSDLCETDPEINRQVQEIKMILQ